MKPLSEWTVAEVKAECSKIKGDGIPCTECAFIDTGVCDGTYPFAWRLPRWTPPDLDDMEAIRLVHPDKPWATKEESRDYVRVWSNEPYLSCSSKSADGEESYGWFVRTSNNNSIEIGNHVLHSLPRGEKINIEDELRKAGRI